MARGGKGSNFSNTPQVKEDEPNQANATQENQEPGTNSQEPGAKSQKPGASQDPCGWGRTTTLQ